MALRAQLPCLAPQHCSAQSYAFHLTGCHRAQLWGTTEMDENTETAVLAGGCFWIAQELLRNRAGVISTSVGYTGGENGNPTAGSHPGHAEAVEVIFDPKRTSYRSILEFFFQIQQMQHRQHFIHFHQLYIDRSHQAYFVSNFR